ncbi:hypothetical protein GCM10010381_14180 [Streptomyces xantholiticus]|nr:hypothetical protein GCM10010381_14180 [Streptomyces xantholiticus]
MGDVGAGVVHYGPPSTARFTAKGSQALPYHPGVAAVTGTAGEDALDRWLACPNSALGTVG